jgi:hypothetical protein
MWKPATKPALPWIFCAIGSLLLLILFGSGRALIIAGIFACFNAMFALGGRAFGWRYNKSREVAKSDARQFLPPSLVFLVILGVIVLMQFFLSPR